jgi:RNA polymerase sigma-70 factor (ECF subfamily)
MKTVMDGVLETALHQLPEIQRLCVVLIDIEEMSYDEAALILEIPVGTVRSRLSRARAKLCEALQQSGAVASQHGTHLANFT